MSQPAETRRQQSDVVMGGTDEARSTSSANGSQPGGTPHDKPMPDLMPVPGSSQGRIGRYQIIKTLGEGSFGKVKRKFSLSDVALQCCDCDFFRCSQTSVPTASHLKWASRRDQPQSGCYRGLGDSAPQEQKRAPRS